MHSMPLQVARAIGLCAAALAVLGLGVACQPSPAAPPSATTSPKPPPEPTPAPSAKEPSPMPTLESPEPAKKAEIVIEVHVDYVCPWCYIGTERLDRALAASGLGERVVVRRLPFLLDPDLPPDGVDLAEHLRKKYGGDPEQMFERVENVAKSVGLKLDFTKQRRTYPTVAAHALMAHLVADGAPEATQRAVERELFETHFVKAGNIANLETLVEIAARHGLDGTSVRAALADPARIDAARKVALGSSAKGVRGVPHFRFPTGEVISGAQHESLLEAAIRKSANH